MRTVHRMILSVSLLFISSFLAQAQPTLEEIGQRIQETRESAQFLSCWIETISIDHSVNPNRKWVSKIKWLETPNIVRWRYETKQNASERIWKDGVERALYDDNPSLKVRDASVTPRTRRDVEESEGPWSLNGFLSGVGSPRKSLPELFFTEKQKLTVQMKGKLVLVVYKTGGFVEEFELDPAVNFWPRRYTAYFADSPKDSPIESENLAFKEIKPGLYLPEKIKRTVKRGSVISRTIEQVYTDYSIPEVVEESTLEVSFPGGTRVIDQVKEKNYLTDPTGKPDPKTVKERSPTPQIVQYPEEKTPWYRQGWFWALIGLLAISVCYFIYRRLRR